MLQCGLYMSKHFNRLFRRSSRAEGRNGHGTQHSRPLVEFQTSNFIQTSVCICLSYIGDFLNLYIFPFRCLAIYHMPLTHPSNPLIPTTPMPLLTFPSQGYLFSLRPSYLWTWKSFFPLASVFPASTVSAILLPDKSAKDSTCVVAVLLCFGSLLIPATLVSEFWILSWYDRGPGDGCSRASHTGMLS